MRIALKPPVSQGFTLLETLASLFIIIVVITGVASLVFRVFNATAFAASRLTAAYLAQEGVEVVRNLRDRAYLEQRAGNSLDWDNFIQAGSFALDYRSQQIPDANCLGNRLRAAANDFYVCTSDASASFQRIITINKVNLDADAGTIEKIEVASTVNWNDTSGARTLTVRADLYDWLR